MMSLNICQNPNILRVIYFIKVLIDIVKFIVPIGLIVMVMLDMGKGVISGDKKPSEILKASGNKLLAAVIIFLLPTIVDFSLGLVSDLSSYESCWTNAELAIIEKYQVLWDDEKSKKEEEEEKQKEEERREEEEEAKREEAEKNNVVTVAATFISTSGNEKVKTCTWNKSRDEVSCVVTAPDASYGWGDSQSCKSGEKGKITLTENVKYYECKGSSSSSGNVGGDNSNTGDDGQKGNVSQVTATFVHLSGTVKESSCSWDDSANKKGCTVAPPSSSYGWGTSSMCEAGNQKSITFNKNTTYYECNRTGNKNLKSATVLFVNSNGNKTAKSCSWDVSKKQSDCSVMVPSSSYGWGTSNTCTSGDKSTIKVNKDSTYYECNPTVNVVVDGAIPLDKFPNITKNKYKGFTYYVYHPVRVTANLPVIVYLPGLGERGYDYGNKSLLGTHAGPLDEVINRGASYNAIIIVMQVPSDHSVGEYINDYYTVTNSIVEQYKANKRKIAVMGLSHGCYGTLNFVSKYPNYFSAAVPIGCSWNPKYYPANNFINQPVWALSGGGDGHSAAYEGHKNFYVFRDAVNEAGGNAKYTYLEGRPHNVFTSSYSVLRDPDLDLINWITSQTRK